MHFHKAGPVTRLVAIVWLLVALMLGGLCDRASEALAPVLLRRMVRSMGDDGGSVGYSYGDQLPHGASDG